MESTNKISVSEEDEEDLEALRLAALQSLKRRNISNNVINGVPYVSEINEFAPVPDHPAWYSNRGGRNFPNKRGRFYGPRGAKNGQFPFHSIPRIRSSNLIAITPIGSDDNTDTEPQPSSTTHRLTLPQDRFYSSEKVEGHSNDSSSKFNRYDNSDESEEETEDEKHSEDSEEENTEKLKRSDSLEALMQELDDEIQGKTKPKEEKTVKTRTKVRRKKVVVTSTVSEVKPAEPETVVITTEPQPELGSVKADVKEPSEADSTLNKSTEEPAPKKQRNSPPYRPVYDNNRRNKRGFVHSNFRRGYQNPPRYVPPVQFASLPPNAPPPLPHLNLNVGYVPPTLPFFDRPLSPLTINTDTLQNQTMAPLSPRSAAFVLENRAIVEKRKRSPRRSYSRSPSPRLRSLSPRSPRRSLTPRRKSRSRSPPKRRSLSPIRRSLSPIRRSLSPRRRSISPKRRSMSPRRNPIRKGNLPAAASSPRNTRPHIRERLGMMKSNAKLDDKKVTPEKDLPEEPTSKVEDKPLDPVLEARKRKFETKEITVKEGVIRLKPKEDKERTQREESESNVVDKDQHIKYEENIEKNEAIEEDLLDEDALLEDVEIELEAKLDFFSDEESGSEAEGRFKTKHQSSAPKPPVLSFSKLVNVSKERVSEDRPLIEGRRRSRRGPNRTRRVATKARSRSPEKKDISATSGSRETGELVREGKSDTLKTSGAKKDSLQPARNRIVMKSERHPESPRKFERKIEIKIKNPSKYERGIGGDKLQDKSQRLKFARDREEKSMEQATRRVEVEGKGRRVDKEDDSEGVVSDDDMETEVIVENGSDDDNGENNVSSEGDLRAQLSKKRAEKLYKILPAEAVPTRLLQNALQGVVFKKKVKKSKSKSRELSNSDGKLPIHLRLGIVGQPDLFEPKPKRKSRKRKNREMQEQV